MTLLATELYNKKEEEYAKKILKDINIDHFFDCCNEHEMDTIIYPKLVRLYNGNLPEIWHTNYFKTKEHITFMINKLIEVAEKFHDSEINIVALKNGGIAAALIDDMAKCPMGDVDTLVKKEDFFVAHNILLEMGFKFKFRSNFEFENLQNAYNDGSSEYYYSDNKENNLWFEMSWRPIAGRWIRIDKEPSASELINDSIYAKNTKVRILSAEDNLLQIAIHNAKHSYVREPGFRLHLDIDRVVKFNEINWDVFVNKVFNVGVKTAVYYSLLIPSKLFGTPIPSEVLQKLKPGFFKNKTICYLLKKVKLLHPKSKKFSKLDFVIFQFLLYDKVYDVFKVIVPSITWLKTKYNFKSNFFILYYLIIRLLDLVGIRKTYKK